MTVIFTSYVVAETADEAEQIAEDEAGDLEPEYTARELTEPLPEADPDGRSVPFGPSHCDDREITVNEAVALVASHKPGYDDLTLMPFADSPPPLQPARIEDYLADGRPDYALRMGEMLAALAGAEGRSEPAILADLCTAGQPVEAEVDRLLRQASHGVEADR